MIFRTVISIVLVMSSFTTARSDSNSRFYAYSTSYYGESCNPNQVRSLNVREIPTQCEADTYPGSTGSHQFTCTPQASGVGNNYLYTGYAGRECANQPTYSGPAAESPPKCHVLMENNGLASYLSDQCSLDLQSLLTSTNLKQSLIMSNYNSLGCPPEHLSSKTYTPTPNPNFVNGTGYKYQCHNEVPSILILSDQEDFPIGINKDTHTNTCQSDPSGMSSYNLKCNWESQNFIDINGFHFPDDYQPKVLPLLAGLYGLIDMYASSNCDDGSFVGTFVPMYGICFMGDNGPEMFTESQGHLSYFIGSGTCNQPSFPQAPVIQAPFGQCVPLSDKEWMKIRPGSSGEQLRSEMASHPEVGRYYEVQATDAAGQAATKMYFGVIGPYKGANTVCHKDSDSESYEYTDCLQGRMVVYSHSDPFCRDLRTIAAYEYMDPSKTIKTFCRPGPPRPTADPVVAPVSQPVHFPVGFPVSFPVGSPVHYPVFPVSLPVAGPVNSPVPVAFPGSFPLAGPVHYPVPVATPVAHPHKNADPTSKPIVKLSVPTLKPSARRNPSPKPVERPLPLPTGAPVTPDKHHLPQPHVITNIYAGYTKTTLKLYSENSCVPGSHNGKKVLLCDA